MRPGRRFVRELARRPALVVWGLVVVATPFYVLASGLPQPSNALLLPLVPLALWGWNGRLDARFVRVIRPLAWFTVWVCLVNYGWALAVGKWTAHESYTIFPLYYVFNLTSFTIALILYHRHGELALRVTIYAVFVAVAIQVVASFAFVTTELRNALFFNNANQLGYYALVAASLIALAQRRLKLGVVPASAGITACAYLAVMSASRAALAGIAVLVVLLVFANPRVILVASLAAVGLVAAGGPIARAIDNVQVRVQRESRLGFAEERGYDRLWTYKQHLLIGAGEGDFARFVDDPRAAREIHSSFATLLFSYGVLGAGLFLAFLARLVRGADLRLSLMLLPTLGFTLSHQGLRFTSLWVLLGVFVALKVVRPPPEASPA